MLRILLLMIAIATPVFGVAAEPDVTEYQVKAVFLSKFCLYVEWPPNTFATADSPIVLGVAGPANLVGLLEGVVKNNTIGHRSLQVRHIDAGADLKGVHLLFVARSEQAQLPKLVAQTLNLPLLLVTESAAGLDDGGAINFSVQDKRVRFDVALDTTSQHGLRLGAQLLKVARAVRGEAGI